jgi:hypothetical protein
MSSNLLYIFKKDLFTSIKIFNSPIKLINMKQLLLLLCSITSISISFVNGQQSDKNSWYETPVALIEDIYRAVSATNSGSVDWERVRSMLLDEAVVILRTGWNESKQFTADGFIQDFKDFYEHPEVKDNGFEEKILNMKSMVYKDIAFIATIYSAAIIGKEGPPHCGVDLWLLNKKEGLWKITSVINEVIPAGQELPGEPEWKF